MITFVIVHYNTPKLTTCLVRSIRKWHDDAKIVIFDNSDKLPFVADLCDEYIDNTAGQIINYEDELKKYPNKVESSRRINGYGSAKHSMAIEWLCNNMNEPFVLLDSDVLLKQPVDFIEDTYMCISDIRQFRYPNPPYCYGPMKIRVLPFITYINPSLMREYGIKFFDPLRMDGLTYEGHGHDTGTSFYEDMMKADSNLLKRIDYTKYVIHFGKGSYTDEAKWKKWCMQNAAYWM